MDDDDAASKEIVVWIYEMETYFFIHFVLLFVCLSFARFHFFFVFLNNKREKKKLKSTLNLCANITSNGAHHRYDSIFEELFFLSFFFFFYPHSKFTFFFLFLLLLHVRFCCLLNCSFVTHGNCLLESLIIVFPFHRLFSFCMFICLSTK